MPRFLLPLAAALLSLGAAAGEPPLPAPACLPGDQGWLEARLGGAVEADLQWRGADLGCTGMLRPDGEGLRLRFAGRLPSGEGLALVFAAPSLAEGQRARGVPVNVTVLHESEGRIYGTMGPDRCVLDEVEQRPIRGAAPPGRSWSVQARGFCTEPARAVGGRGSVFLSRFDFVGRLDVTAEEVRAALVPPPGIEPLSSFPQAEVVVESGRKRHVFKAWVADTLERRTQGLMYVPALAPGRAMLFPNAPARHVAFWMRNTYIPLDLIFIAPGGRITNIIENAEPLSERPLESSEPVIAVLEVAGGTTSRLGIAPGHRVRLPRGALSQP
ncbi:MAG: DUF192 domain-containing protein [Steroidobacteraceae bacterium]|jgi:hypothetical protein|nr:DUF192 domain-containing protein [Steroidobacteraceae bacterium]